MIIFTYNLKTDKMKLFNQGQEERIYQAVAKRLTDYSAQGRDITFSRVSADPESREHIVSIGTSILCTKWGVGFPGGSFVQAVVDNDLMGAFSRADSINSDCIKFYTTLIYNTRYIE